jgi:hypothetical protein
MARPLHSAIADTPDDAPQSHRTCGSRAAIWRSGVRRYDWVMRVRASWVLLAAVLCFGALLGVLVAGLPPHTEHLPADRPVVTTAASSTSLP